MRQLATIQKISELAPIPGADKIVLVSMHGNGWKCISAIDNGFKVGDLIIYVEIDSRLPADNPAFAFMEKRNYKVKTIKMRGVYSCGLVLPLSVLPETTIPGGTFPVEGADVTSILKVTKIDTDEPGEVTPGKKQHPMDAWLCKFKLYREIRPYIFSKKDRGWPSEIPHTDETRIQALWNTLEPLFQLNKKWYITTKIDGQSATYYYKKRMFSSFFGLYSRELRKKEGDNSNWAKMAEKYKIKECCIKFCKSLKLKSVWLQGEIAGPSIQGNKNRFTEKRFFIFNIFVPQWKRYLSPHEMGTLFLIGTEMEVVPFDERTYTDGISLAGKTIDDLVAMSNGPSEWSKDDLREGIVIREMEDYGLSRISFKVISPEFCIKYGL